MAEDGVFGTNALVLETSDKALDLTGVPTQKTNELKNKLAQSMIASRERKTELSLSLQGLDAKLSGMTDVVSRGVAAGLDSTVRNVTEDASGKTEILIGNSARARHGSRIMLPSKRKVLLALAFLAAAWLGLRAARAWIVTRLWTDGGASAPKARMI